MRPGQCQGRLQACIWHCWRRSWWKKTTEVEGKEKTEETCMRLVKREMSKVSVSRMIYTSQYRVPKSICGLHPPELGSAAYGWSPSLGRETIEPAKTDAVPLASYRGLATLPSRICWHWSAFWVARRGAKGAFSGRAPAVSSSEEAFWFRRAIGRGTLGEG